MADGIFVVGTLRSVGIKTIKPKHSDRDPFDQVQARIDTGGDYFAVIKGNLTENGIGRDMSAAFADHSKGDRVRVQVWVSQYGDLNFVGVEPAEAE